MWESNGPATFPWSEVSIFAGEIDVRTKVKQILSERGHNVFVRKNSDRRCSCWSDRQYDESNQECPRCNGHGWIYYDYLYKTYHRPVMGASRLDPQMLAPFGDVQANDCIFYFAYDNLISEAYSILEVTLDVDGSPSKPYRIERMHSVKMTHSYRDKGGRIEYWAALTRENDLGK